MSFNPDDYPESRPDDWYNEWPGQIVGHVSLLRDMLDVRVGLDEAGVEAAPSEGPVDTWSPRITFNRGHWIEMSDGKKVFFNDRGGGNGIVLGLDETDPDNPVALLGDYEEYHSDDNHDKPDVALPMAQVSLLSMGYIIGMTASPERHEKGVRDILGLPPLDDDS